MQLQTASCERKEAGKLEPGEESLRRHAGLAESGPKQWKALLTVRAAHLAQRGPGPDTLTVLSSGLGPSREDWSPEY